MDPRNDFAFKRVFGAEKHKHIPIDFLNAVFHLENEHQIVSLEFLDIKQAPHIDARKESTVDVLVEDLSGIKYIVEMQVVKVEGFEKRAQYYAAKTYCEHCCMGGKYSDVKKVMFLAITNYIFFPKKEGYKSDHVILPNDNLSQENDRKNFHFTFVELPKFTKSLEELTTVEDRWYYFLKHADESKNIAQALSEHLAIKDAYAILDRYEWTDEDIQWYEKLTMDDIDAQGIIDAARSAGREEARQEELANLARAK